METIKIVGDKMDIFNFKGFYNFPAICGVELFYNAGKNIIVFTELPENEGISVTNAFELIATQYYNWRGLNKDQFPIIWIEHYPASEDREETYDLVELEYKNHKFFGPFWKPISKEEFLELIRIKI
jgi:hypothetical protein